MYNQFTKELLLKITAEDANTYKGQKKYKISDNFSTIELYVNDTQVSYKVWGDAYILAMTKWLQIKLANGQSLTDISLESLIETFELPEVKLRNAVQVLELIEKINEI